MNYLILIVSGFICGLLSTLFGLGGGLTIVPTLVVVLPFFGVPPSEVMHIAIGSALMIMFINSLNSLRLHHSDKNIEWVYFRKIIFFVIIGTVIGSIISYHLNTLALMIIFQVLLFFILFRFFFQLIKKNRISYRKFGNKKLKQYNLFIYGIITGIVSTCVGGGSSLIMVPLFKREGLKIIQATALAISFNIFISLVAITNFTLLSRINAIHRTPSYSMGLIYWPAVLLILIGSFGGAPIGIKIANKLKEKYAIILYFMLIIVIFFIMAYKLSGLIYSK